MCPANQWHVLQLSGGLTVLILLIILANHWLSSYLLTNDLGSSSFTQEKVKHWLLNCYGWPRKRCFQLVRDLNIHYCVSFTQKICKMSLVSSRWHLLCKVCSPSLVRAKLEIPPEHIWSIQCFTTGKTGFQTSVSEETGRDQINCCFATAYTETSHSFQLVLILLIVYDHLAFPHHFCCQNPGNSTQAPR